MRLDERGQVRTVGVEIELAGLDVGGLAAAVARMFGGKPIRETDYLARIPTDLGEFQVKADLALLQRIGKRRVESPGPAVVAAVRDAVASVAEWVAPFEVIGPPMPYTGLPRMDELAAELGRMGGHGSDSGLLLALGLQLNPEVPRSDAATIHAHLRAYALLEPWLRMRRGIDLARRISPFVDPYPEPYIELLLGQQTAPPLPRLIDDYLRFNPTRNHGLDMLPLFAHLDRERVARAVDDPRVKSRPTFHYRLPDSRIGHAGQLVTDEWRHWLVVERVAAQPPLAATLISARRQYALDEAGVDWPEQCDAVLAAANFGADPSARS